jgi:hypothetical protein
MECQNKDKFKNHGMPGTEAAPRMNTVKGGKCHYLQYQASKKLLGQITA